MQHLHPSPLVFPHKYCFHLAATNRDCSSSLPNLSGAPCRIMTSQLAGPAFILLFKSFFLLVSFQLLILVGCLHPLSLHQVQPTHQECYQGHRCLHSHAKQFFFIILVSRGSTPYIILATNMQLCSWILWPTIMQLHTSHTRFDKQLQGPQHQLVDQQSKQFKNI